MESIRAVFGKKKTFYEILGISKDASASDIRKAYFRLARLCHPDKCPDDPEAKTKFQALSLVHATLSDEEKRKVYDETGALVDDDVTEHSDKEWYDYWRNLFPRVTKEMIVTFQGEYQGGEEEKSDVLKAYTASKGDMAGIIDSVLLATDEDEERFRSIIEEAIEAGEVERYKSFDKSFKAKKKRKQKAEKEAKEAEELLKELEAKRGNSALAKLKDHRQKEFGSFLESIEAKYASSGKAKKKAKTTHEMTDEEFEKAQQKLVEGKGSKGKGKSSA